MDENGRRGHNQKLFKKRFRLDVRKCAFSNRVVDNWNLLSPQCVNCCTVSDVNQRMSYSNSIQSKFHSKFNPSLSVINQSSIRTVIAR